MLLVSNKLTSALFLLVRIRDLALHYAYALYTVTHCGGWLFLLYSYMQAYRKEYLVWKLLIINFLY